MKQITVFTWSGIVVHGQQLGRTIGFPTANFDRVPPETQLKPGVYAGVASLPIQPSIPALIYFGPRLVLSETKNVFEVFLYNFDQEIYGQTMEVSLTSFIRPPQPFASFEEMKLQLEKDKAAGSAMIK